MNPAATSYKQQHFAARLSQFSICVLAIALLSSGCRLQPPGGQPIEPGLLGSVVDEANRTQEENAEASKFIIYMHEFEPNTPNHADLLRGQATIPGEFEFQTKNRIQGFRLNPDGQDHVRQIARHLIATQQQGGGQLYAPHRFVVIERSDTSKIWESVHRFPVHYKKSSSKQKVLLMPTSSSRTTLTNRWRSECRLRFLLFRSCVKAASAEAEAVLVVAVEVAEA